MALLAVDVGAGTQDILLYEKNVPLENSAKMVMPSQTVIVGRKIDLARQQDRDVFLTGFTMGGGSSTKAVKRHLEAGLKVYATPFAALTLKDDLERVKAMGVVIQEKKPQNALAVGMSDLDLDALKETFQRFGFSMPENIAVAVQDHGYAPDRSNRIVRFEQMARILKAGGKPESFAYIDPPLSLNRMCAVKKNLKDQCIRSLIMDSGPAAILGATLDSHYAEPALVLNLGNGHTIGAVMMEKRIVALFEHHTSLMTPEKLSTLAQKLCDGTLTNSEVFDDGGHGACVEDAPGIDAIRSVMVTGPNRNKILRSGVLQNFGEITPAAPGGDMMITGCLGLIKAWKKVNSDG
ncbi:MAG: DUF1786 domain-containing protein [Methanotrichaceae archaeon]